MAELKQLKYRVYSSRNPVTGGVILRPVVTQRVSISMRQLIEHAKAAGFVRGQQRDLEGLLSGFIEAMQDRAKAGYSINVNGWFVISGQLKGTVGEDRKLTPANEYHITIAASKDLKVDISNFSWTRVDDNVPIAKIERLCSTNGTQGEIIRMQEFVAIGRNFSFNAAWGDRIIVSWTEDENEKSADLTPRKYGSDFMNFDWPEALESVPTGTELTFTFRLHGEEGAPEQVCKKTAKLVAK